MKTSRGLLRPAVIGGLLCGGALFQMNVSYGSPSVASANATERREQISTLDDDRESSVLLDEARTPPKNLLLGITVDGPHQSRLVTVDQATGAIVQTHLQLDEHDGFYSMTFDRNHHKLYALGVWPRNLYAIDTRTLALKHIGNLRINDTAGSFIDVRSLAYDPRTDTLFTAVQYGAPPDPYGPIWTELARIDPETAEISVIGRIDGVLVEGFAFSEQDQCLYGLARLGKGPADTYQVVRINPVTARTDILFPTPYSFMKGFALKSPSSFISWINEDGQGHFYAETDLTTHTTVPLGHTETGHDYVFATVFENFSIKDEAPPRTPAPSAFSYEGVVETISDPDGVVGGSILPGDRFTGEFRYDASAPYSRRLPNGHPPYGLSLHFNGSDYVIEGLTAYISNNYYRPTFLTLSDTFDLQAHIDDVIRVTWHLEDPTMRALKGNDKLPTRFALPKWSTNELEIIFFSPEGHRLYTISGRIDRIRRLKNK